MVSTRRAVFVTLPVFFTLVAVVFQVVTCVGGLDRAGLRDLYFLRMNTSNIVPASETPYASTLNTVAQRLGLQNFYQTSLFTYCYGNATTNGTTLGPVTGCNASSIHYAFSPVKIIENSLAIGAQVNVPTDVQNAMTLIDRASTALKVLCIAGACLAFVVLLLSPCVYASRLGTFFVWLIAVLSFLANTAAAVVAQIMYTVVRNIINEDVTEFNVIVTLGTTLFALIWVAAGASILCMLLMTFAICCCPPHPHDRLSHRDRKRLDKERIAALSPSTLSTSTMGRR
ncbi:hypothetical protein PYCC9005_000101 [Savitreella phatthalungensis]